MSGFLAYSFARAIRKQGTPYTFVRPEKNVYGETIVSDEPEVNVVYGLLNDRLDIMTVPVAQASVSGINADSGSPFMIALNSSLIFPDGTTYSGANVLQIGDIVTIADVGFTVVAINNFGNQSIVLQIILKEV